MIQTRQRHAIISRQVCAISNDKDSLYISWQQRVSKKAEVVGTGYFLQTPYTHNRDGLKQQALNSLIAASKRAV